MKTTRTARRGARQLFRLCALNGTLDESRAREVTVQLAASRRRGALAILSAFQRLVRLDRDRHAAFVESAVPLPDSLRRTVHARLVSLYGAGVDAAFEHDPTLIGGLRIRVGSHVYDGSVRARLAAVDAAFQEDQG